MTSCHQPVGCSVVWQVVHGQLNASDWRWPASDEIGQHISDRQNGPILCRHLHSLNATRSGTSSRWRVPCQTCVKPWSATDSWSSECRTRRSWRSWKAEIILCTSTSDKKYIKASHNNYLLLFEFVEQRHHLWAELNGTHVGRQLWVDVWWSLEMVMLLNTMAVHRLQNVTSCCRRNYTVQWTEFYTNNTFSITQIQAQHYTGTKELKLLTACTLTKLYICWQLLVIMHKKQRLSHINFLLNLKSQDIL